MVPGGSVYRPPSEADSLLLQVSVGCSHNRCSYCAMYTDKRFAIRPQAEVEALIDAFARARPAPSRRVFLCDGDALILPQARLVATLAYLRARLPWVERVATYGDCRSILRKTPAELRELADLGLGMVYHGVETGDDLAMAAIVKGSTRAQVIEAADRLRQAGIRHSVIVLLGIGGVAGSERHAHETASLLSRIDPPFVGALTVTPVPGTPLYLAQQAGEFVLPDPWQLLGELRVLVAESALTACQFASNHASNYLPLRALLARDRQPMLRAIDAVLAERDAGMLKPEWLRGL
ncbi:MAG: radical SAM protein [Deltaproteobacteria bacterium]|nr:radical SAM protein [Deltaproteobacteria bacterium]